MPWFKVVARRGGKIELLSGDAAKDAKLGEGDVEVGEFHAENEPEAWRQLATANPQIDMEKQRVVITADADAAVAEQKREFEEKVRAETIENLEIPDDTGSPQDEEEVEEEEEEDDPEKPGQKKKVKKTKKVKKEGTGRKKAKSKSSTSSSRGGGRR